MQSPLHRRRDGASRDCAPLVGNSWLRNSLDTLDAVVGRSEDDTYCGTLHLASASLQLDTLIDHTQSSSSRVVASVPISTPLEPSTLISAGLLRGEHRIGVPRPITLEASKLPELSAFSIGPSNSLAW